MNINSLLFFRQNTARGTSRMRRPLLFCGGLLAGVVVVLSTQDLLTADLVTRGRVEQDLHAVIDAAASQYRIGAGLRAQQRNGAALAEESQRELLRIAKQKRALRLEVARLRRVRDAALASGIDATQPASLHAAASQVERQLPGLVDSVVLPQVWGQTPLDTVADASPRSLVASDSLGERIERAMRRDALWSVQTAFLQLLTEARIVPDRLAEAEASLGAMQERYLVLLRQQESAERTERVSAARLAEIQRIMAEVHDQVLALQSELARIDARIARRTERSLIEMGLRSPQTGAYSDGTAWMRGPMFSWPVFGPVTAQFHDDAYVAHFGVAHDGMDIAAAQGSPVRAAADGVVFLARDGGATGYSYILIGHRAGYATLYGHLSSFAVRSGDDVSAGDVIGMSGGQPGTPGAGPMTTGSHLHFEVILNGANIDPLTVLP